VARIPIFFWKKQEKDFFGKSLPFTVSEIRTVNLSIDSVALYPYTFVAECRIKQRNNVLEMQSACRIDENFNTIVIL
jgi:hypothetical protein